MVAIKLGLCSSGTLLRASRSSQRIERGMEIEDKAFLLMKANTITHLRWTAKTRKITILRRVQMEPIGCV